MSTKANAQYMHDPGKSKTVFTRNVKIWDPLGSPHAFSVALYIKAVTHPRFLVYGGLTLLLFFATDPSNNRAYVEWWESALIWPVAFLMYMLFYATALTVQSLCTSVISSLRVPTPFLGFITLFPTVYVSEKVLLDYMSNGTFPDQLAGNYIFYFISVQVSEALFYRYIYPGLREELDAAERPEDEAEVKHIIIGGERILLADVVTIEAREHHVHVTLTNSNLTLRARLSDVIAQTKPCEGVQTHRSYWVSRNVIQGLGQANGRPVLVLKNDATVPIARTRMAAVEDWLEDHLDDTATLQAAAE